MTTKTKEVVLTHDQAMPVLKVIPLDKNSADMSSDELAAVTHYAHCKDCREIGLNEMLGIEMSHQEAILIWAKNLGALHSAGNKSLLEECAVEHVWGKYEVENVRKGEGYNTATGCSHKACSTLSRLWLNSYMSLFYDGEDSVAQEFPLILEIFVAEGWPLDELLSIQKDRVKALLSDLEKGEVTVSLGHYSLPYHMAAELLKHVGALQKLVLE